MYHVTSGHHLAIYYVTSRRAYVTYWWRCLIAIRGQPIEAGLAPKHHLANPDPCSHINTPPQDLEGDAPNSCPFHEVLVLGGP
jgi:hypothetical protein